MLGSVADKVMRLATRPVLLVRGAEGGASDRVPRLARLLVPLDGSEQAEAAIAPAADLAARSGAALTLVRIEPVYGPMLASYAAMNEIARLDAEAEEQARDYLAVVRARLPEGAEANTVVLRGAPATELIAFAEREGIDLIVMTTHGHGGMRRLVLGSVADRIVRAALPVLLIRPPLPLPAEPPAPAEPVAAPARRCAQCGRLVTYVVEPERQCIRCHAHLYGCANCVFSDGLACILQRSEAHDRAWAGRNCPRFTFRETSSAPQSVSGAGR
jgi:nucleotide-binding universal stress UspA family protein